ncbi:C25 family cysteine peptidase [Agriterribacter sp.]|uniref:C25 family cysteine peptidase n=1 Tax=Agriterribacter sp. TaxID=2821509 RepID=UPI002B98A512|nr:C25 family cysteine peptidase [Agriterribacter sp.]HRO48298.1 C25 family cysteine peptidase [Agriterribacter sp.]HRQ19274.1 C25 family cysteine peptidase [Agriterribacter sp.]
MYAKKIIITAKSTLTLKYGSAFPKINKLLQALKAADKKRGIAARIVFIDDAVSAKQAGIKPVKNVTARECKRAVDDLYKKYVPDYIVLAGSQDIFPFQDIHNPADADGDMTVPSDLPYACDAPYSKNIQSFTGPTRVVGRIPDVPGENDIQYFTTIINNIIKAKPRKEALYMEYFGISAYVWRKSTELSLQSMVGNYSNLLLSPGSATSYTAAQLKKRTHFYNCHGAQNDMAFYGQKGSSYPVAISSAQLKGKISEGTIVAAECCYGAELVNPVLLPQPNALSIANMYLNNNAVAFMGSSTIAYGPADAQGLADLITQYFIKNIIGGASTGRALLQARQQFLSESGPHLDPYELKTVAQFHLLGDPSVLPVIDDSVRKIVSQNTVQNTRMKLFNKGSDLKKNLAPSHKEKTVTPSAHQKDLNTLLKETGFTAYDKKGLYKASIKTGTQSIAEKKLAPRTARFRTFVKAISTPGSVGFNNIKVLVVKESSEQLLGWRIYERR